MRLLLAVCLVVGCQRVAEEPALTPAPEPRPAVGPVKPPPVKPFAKPTQIMRRDNQTLCVRDANDLERCRRLGFDYFNKSITTGDAKPGHETTLTRDGVACTALDGQLICGSTSTPVTEHYGGYYVYLEEPRGVSWFEPDPSSTGPSVLHAMAPLPGGIAQLAIGFRIGCARTTQAEVYCWSDPTRPRKVPTPANVVDIALQDPFELCVRTASGELHCAAPYKQSAEMICSKHSIACGTGEVEKVNLKTSFDPLTKVLRPLRRVALSHAATDVEVDDAPIYQFCLDSLFVGTSDAGACTLGDGKVSCISVCGERWGTKAVAGLPTTIQHVWSEGATAYALATDGALYWWSRQSDCVATATTATKFSALPPIANVAAPLLLQSGPQSHEPVRCALASTGEVRCWQADRDGTPTTPFDPMR